MKRALLIVDVQNDFCPGGALDVPKGDEVVPVINRLSASFDHVIQSQDWHTEGHHSFASSHPGKDPFETIEAPYGEQILWPDHCVQGSRGAEFHPGLVTTRTQAVIRKGYRKEIDSYSTFYENDQKTPTGLAGYLNEHEITDLYVCGLATDFCVNWSVTDGCREGYKIFVIEDAVRGIDLEGSVARAWNEMEQAGAKRIQSSELTP